MPDGEIKPRWIDMLLGWLGLKRMAPTETPMRLPGFYTFNEHGQVIFVPCLQTTVPAITLLIGTP